MRQIWLSFAKFRTPENAYEYYQCDTTAIDFMDKHPKGNKGGKLPATSLGT
jgi:hypothetical protein